MENMIAIARENTQQLGKTDHFSAEELANLSSMLGIGALKYFILKVDPKKNMLFNPEESIDLNGNTAPFIQYTHARICSLLRKATEIVGADVRAGLNPPLQQPIHLAEKELLRILYDYPAVVKQSGIELSPALIANYTYELVKTYNHFYQDTPVLREANNELRIFRLQLSLYTADVIKQAMNLLGIEVPEKM
jgi:arginyl-tRNA synthetase